MSVKASEISDLIRQRIEKFSAASEARNVGTVVSVTDGICRIHGLADVRYGEMIEFPGSLFGLALNLEQDSVGAVVLGDYKSIREGDTALFSRGHVGLVESYDPTSGRLVTIEGNSIGEAVRRRTYNLNDPRDRAAFEGFGRPARGDFDLPAA